MVFVSTSKRRRRSCLVGEAVHGGRVAVDRELERGLDLEVGVLPGRGLEVDHDQAPVGVALDEVEGADQASRRRPPSLPAEDGAQAMMGTLVKGLGADHVVWGTDAIWTGSPQWQIEALRRLEIPEDMQKKYGFAPLGPADGPVKRAIFGENSARLYKYDIKRRAELTTDRIALAKADYEREGPGRTNLRYGFVVNSIG